ncbi:ATP phosphoribosyltransferase [candidate division KSB1 bacterium]|nr:ATP phosphoribosyltransferase [candidate division KSB1 bacterium]
MSPAATQELFIALSKGKLLPPALQWLARTGYTFSEKDLAGRKLVLTAKEGRLHAVLVKADDVPIYVEYGVADLGIVGKDTLLESEAEVFEPLDLGFGRCRLVVAGKPEHQKEDLRQRALVRVGTKYPKIARWHFDRVGVQAEIIALKGSVELSVLAGLAEVVVDIVETGTTLRENGLVVYHEILSSSARLIVNKASHKLKSAEIDALLRKE